MIPKVVQPVRFGKAAFDMSRRPRSPLYIACIEELLTSLDISASQEEKHGAAPGRSGYRRKSEELGNWGMEAHDARQRFSELTRGPQGTFQVVFSG